MPSNLLKCLDCHVTNPLQRYKSLYVLQNNFLIEGHNLVFFQLAVTIRICGIIIFFLSL